MSSQEVKGKDVVSKEVNYSKLNRVAPRYKLVKLYPTTNSQTVTLEPSGTTSTDIELPANKPFNFAQSQLAFSVNLYESTTANHCLWRWADNLAPISGMEIFTKQGKYLLQFTQGLPNFLSVVRRTGNKFQNYITNEDTVGLVKCNTTTANNRRSTNADSNVAYLETKYLEVGAARDGAGAGNTQDIYRFNLSEFIDTLLALDKDIAFPDITTLRITWNSTYKICWTAPSTTNPSTSAQAYNSTTAATITDITVWLAVEQEPSLVKEVISAMDSGKLVFLFPSVRMTKNPVTSQQDHFISNKLSRVDGMTLLKAISIPFNATENLNTTYDHNNISYVKVQSLRTAIDSDYLTTYDIDCEDNTDIDYEEVKDRLKGSLYLSKDIYKYKWFYEDNFSGSKLSDEKSVDDSNVMAGLSLEKEFKYDLSAHMKTSQSTIWHQFFVTQRVMKIGPNDIEIK
jgi:hypothetical protein